MKNTEITDKEAVSALETTNQIGAQVANHFVERTIVYPVQVEYQPGIPSTEVRTFVRMAEYCSEAQWAEALELEKQYPELQKAYTAMLKKKGVPVSMKAPGNPLKATPISLGRN